MIHIKEILMPTDFSNISSAALGHAAMMADRFGARLTLLHVSTSKGHGKDKSFPAIDPETDELAQVAEYQISEMSGLEPLPHLRVRHELRTSDDPAAEITNYARENHIDLIVVGTHGRTGLSHLVLGSVAETVIRRASCPVITVRISDASAQVSPYLDILAPIDFSPDSEKALHYAWTLADLFDANLHLLHVIDFPVHPDHYAVNAILADHLDQDLTERTHEEMDKLIAKHASVPVRHQTCVVSGRAYSEIVQFAQTHDIDLIVMGTRGLSRLKNFLLGGTAAKVVRHASCPVLTIKLKERDFVA